MRRSLLRGDCGGDPSATRCHGAGDQRADRAETIRFCLLVSVHPSKRFAGTRQTLSHAEIPRLILSTLMDNQNVLSRLLLQGADFGRYSVKAADGTDTNILSGLSRINFFVGPNNSGKSTLLRQLLRIDRLRFGPPDGFREVADLAAELRAGVNAIQGRGIQEISGWVAGVSSFGDFDFVAEGDQPSSIQRFLEIGRFCRRC